HAFLDILRIRVDDDMTRSLERLQGLDDALQLHAIVGGSEFSATQFLLVATVLQQGAPPTGTGVAFASPVRPYMYCVYLCCVFICTTVMVIHYISPGVFLNCRPAATAPLIALRERFHAGPTNVGLATRFTAETTYAAPQIGHHRSPAFSMN